MTETECTENCEPPLLANTINACKYYDANADGSRNNSDFDLADWPMSIFPLDGATPQLETKYTGVDGCVTWDTLTDDTYTITEGVPIQPNWFNSEPGVPVQSVSVSGNEEKTVEFGNFCIGPGGGLTLGYWSNKNGYDKMNDAPSGVAPELGLLGGLNLRDASGNNFDPSCYCKTGACPPGITGPSVCSTAPFRTWILNATATNMAYMLSAQLAAMALNVEANFVSGGSLVRAGTPPANCNVPGLNSTGVISIADLMNAANSAAMCNGSNCSLADAGNTTASGAARSCQEFMKNALDDANNNRNFVQQDACPATFPSNS